MYALPSTFSLIDYSVFLVVATADEDEDSNQEISVLPGMYGCLARPNALRHRWIFALAVCMDTSVPSQCLDVIAAGDDDLEQNNRCAFI